MSRMSVVSAVAVLAVACGGGPPAPTGEGSWMSLGELPAHHLYAFGREPSQAHIGVRIGPATPLGHDLEILLSDETAATWAGNFDGMHRGTVYDCTGKATPAATGGWVRWVVPAMTCSPPGGASGGAPVVATSVSIETHLSRVIAPRGRARVALPNGAGLYWAAALAYTPGVTGL